MDNSNHTLPNNSDRICVDLTTKNKKPRKKKENLESNDTKVRKPRGKKPIDINNPRPRKPRTKKSVQVTSDLVVDDQVVPTTNILVSDVTVDQKNILKPISNEQQDIVDKVITNKNMMINAVAGSGKTTTSLYIAIKNQSKRILLLTYNAKLKLETRSKVIQLNIDNMEVHSYHSFCVKYLNSKAYTDSGMIEYNKKIELSGHFEQLRPFQYDIIIIDEAQDMNFIYYQIVHHIINRLNCQLVVMGDQKQSIYQFNNADSRFLTMASQIYTNNYEWQNGNLSTSYRLTSQMAQFINHCCNGTLPINTIKSGPLVRYLVCDTFGGTPLRIISNLLSGGYNPSDIFVLTPSVKSSKSPIRQLANRLSTKSIPIYVPTSDDEKLDDQILDHKIVFSTYHQVKGLERRIVMVFGFDSSYFKYYATDIPTNDYDQIPNTLYVAITRATEHLILLHDDKQDYLEFLNRYSLRQYTKLEISCNFNPKVDNKWTKTKHNRQISVTDLTSYVPVEILNDCMSYLSYKQIQDNSQLLDIPSKIKQNELYESIREIIGQSILYYYEYKVTGNLSMYNHLIKCTINKSKCLLDGDDNNSIYDKLYKQLNDNDNRPKALLELTTHWMCDRSGYTFKKQQIKDYDWLPFNLYENACDRIIKVLGLNDSNEFIFEKEVSGEYDNYTIHGHIDIYNRMSDDIWELKVVNDVDNVHLLQTAVYMWLINLTGKLNNGYLFNVMDNRLYQLDSQNLNKIVEILINHKKEGNIIKSNIEFVSKCSLISNRKYSIM